jgi:type I restriction enzyme R subunit
MMNEAETRLHLIDPALREKGYLDGRWQVRAERPLPIDPGGNKGKRKKGAKPCDYLLCVWLEGMPKALPERYALATGIDLTQPAAQLLFMEDSKAYGSKPRYYQA